ncbi:hypothetical protein [Streptomyces sp. KL110A]
MVIFGLVFVVRIRERATKMLCDGPPDWAEARLLSPSGNANLRVPVNEAP